MTDMLRATREEESRRREELQLHQLQQQMDELRRAMRDQLARQQWLEEVHKQNEAKLAQTQLAQDRYVQDITQAMQARQMEDARVKQQIADLATRVEEPLKPLRDLRAQVSELLDSRRTDRERTTTELRPLQEVQGQMRELVAQIAMVANAQRQLRDLVQDLDTVNAETRQEIGRVAELQRMEEQRLRRQGSELQVLVEETRTQFTDVVARAQRIDELRKYFLEHVEGLTKSIGEMQQEDARMNSILQRLEKQSMEARIAVEERVESQRAHQAGEVTELRQSLEQRLDRFYERFQQIDDRLREYEQRMADIVPQIERLHRDDQDLEGLVDSVEEAHLRQELANIETQLEIMRQRRVKRQAETATRKGEGLIKNVREARTTTRPNQPEETTQLDGES